jgi:hypothetical protein
VLWFGANAGRIATTVNMRFETGTTCMGEKSIETAHPSTSIQPPVSSYLIQTARDKKPYKNIIFSLI